MRSIRNLLVVAAILIVCLTSTIRARIHHLRLEDDRREQVTVSTFGFLKNGFLQVRVNQLSFYPLFRLDAIRNSFAFILEKNQNRGFSSFSAKSKNQDFCALMKRLNQMKNLSSDQVSSLSDDQAMFDHRFLEENNEFFRIDPYQNYSLLIVHLDLLKAKANVTRIGKDMRNLRVRSDFSQNPYGFQGQQQQIKKQDPLTTTTSASTSNQTQNGVVNNDLINLIEGNMAILKMLDLKVDENKGTVSFNFQVDIGANEEGLYVFNFFNCLQPDVLGRYDSLLKSSINTMNKTIKASDSSGGQGVNVFELSDNYVIEHSQGESHYGIGLDLEMIEHNEDSYLSAGELPVPTLYLTWSIIYFLAGISWMYILKNSKGEVHKIHYLMLGLVFIKSITLTFHAINMHYIAINGRHEAIWAILYYITYVLRGLLLIISILLVGTGWTFIKHVLSENERRLFVIVIPLQILAITSYIFLEEKEEGDAVYLTWRQLFFLLDLICCGAILFPVVWSIRHLEAGSKTDGKMAINLRKLRVFKHFYVIVICYIYFTRIIGFLLRQILPFRYEWFDELVTEVVTFVFFALTAHKFQPTVNNPYLQLAQIDDDEDEEGGGGGGMGDNAGDSLDLQMENVVNENDPNRADPNVTLFDVNDYTGLSPSNGTANSQKKRANGSNGLNHKGLMDSNNVVSRAAKQQQSRV